jgi:cell division protein ZapA
VESASRGNDSNEISDSRQDRSPSQTDGIPAAPTTLNSSSQNIVSEEPDCLFKTQVEIFGQKYTIISEEAAEHVELLAQFVDEKMNEIAQQSKGMSTLKVAILAALNIAEEMFRLRGKTQDVVIKQSNLIQLLQSAIGE